MIGYKIVKNDAGREHVVLVSPGNHEVLMSSQVYRGESSAESLVELLVANGLQIVHQESLDVATRNADDGNEGHAIGDLDI